MTIKIIMFGMPFLLYSIIWLMRMIIWFSLRKRLTRNLTMIVGQNKYRKLTILFFLDASTNAYFLCCQNRPLCIRYKMFSIFYKMFGFFFYISIFPNKYCSCL